MPDAKAFHIFADFLPRRRKILDGLRRFFRLEGTRQGDHYNLLIRHSGLEPESSQPKSLG
ncbi:hypothetical protein AT6N2_C1625 [Agrobacterium tumefaciens]|nr:hypothetical protein AT6N2_C1625 [Agrobacterium tumefaciens]